MKLLELDDMIGIPTAEASQIQAFHDIIKRDRTHRKRVASKELAYIFYLCHWDSPYTSYPEEIRHDKVKKDVFEEEEWSPDDKVQKAIEVYKDLTENEFKSMLDGARSGAYKLTQYFKNIDLEATDDHGKPIHSAKDLIYNLEKVGKVMEGIEKLIEMVKKNEEKQKGNRAGVETNMFNE